MKIYIKILILLILLSIPSKILSEGYIYILNDRCINELYNLSKASFQNTGILFIKDARGVVLRFKLANGKNEVYKLSSDTYSKIKKIEYFLAKIENPVIIEVHTEKNREAGASKNWEISTIIANNIEAIITKPYGVINQNRIISVGYGEFLPMKNPPNNGGIIYNRVDIIVLCNISGE